MNGRYHKTIGIDLGTTYSAVASMDRHEREAAVFNDPEGIGDARSMPSVIGFDKHAGRLLLGLEAKNNLTNDPDNTIVEIKREMGELFTAESLVSFGAEGIYHVGDPVRVKMGDRWYLPQEVSSLILMKLRGIASAEIGSEIIDAVVTVPAYFTDKQLNATREAALLAGLYPRELIQEPTAAAISFGVQALDNEPRLYLVYDLGGGTFDVSIIEVSPTGIQVLAISGEHRLGGVDFDERITEWALEEIRTKHKKDLSEDPHARARIKQLAEKTKIALSDNKDAPLVLVDVLAPETASSLTLERATFESMISPDLERTEKCIEQAIERAAEKGVKRDDIQAVLLVGGSTRIPEVKRRLREYFGKGDDFVREDCDPVTAVATGAAHVALRYAPSNPPFEIQQADEVALINADALGGFSMHNITGHTLGVEVTHGGFVPIIPAGTSFPVSITSKGFTNAAPTNAVHVRVYQGEHSVCENNEFIGVVPIENIEPLPLGTHRFDITYSLDRSGILSTSVYHQNANATHQVTFQHATGSKGSEALGLMRKNLLDLYATRPGQAAAGAAAGGGIEIPPPPPPPGHERPEQPRAESAQADRVQAVQPQPDQAQPPQPERGAEAVAPVVEIEKTIPDRFQMVVEIVRDRLADRLDATLLKAYNAFAVAVNEERPEEQVEALGQALSGALKNV